MNIVAIFGISLIILVGTSAPNVVKGEISNTQAGSSLFGDVNQYFFNDSDGNSVAQAHNNPQRVSENSNEGNLKVKLTIENGCNENFEVRINNQIKGNMQGCDTKTFRVDASIGSSLEVCAFSTNSYLEGCSTVYNGEEKRPEKAYINVS